MSVGRTLLYLELDKVLERLFVGYQVPESPFQDLPEALVEEMLSQYKRLGERLSESFEEVLRSRDKVREALKTQKLLKDDSTIIASHTHPTTCGVDGSYAIERLLSTDIAAMAAVAVEGLTPPS